MLQGNFFKVIFQGKLEFGTARSYNKIVQLYEQKSEVLYKKEVLFKATEEIFVEEDLSLTINRFIGTSSDKVWKNTISLLEYCAQFSVSGSLNGWMTENGGVLQHVHIEPKAEKSSVMLYHEGKKMAEKEGREKEAIDLLTEAIEKHNRHSQAYEKRGYINFHLKNFDDAIYDFKKSVSFDPMNSSSFYGLGRAYMIKKDLITAINYLDEAVKQSIALQAIHWASRRAKGNCHLDLKEFDKAAFEFKLFTSRNFLDGDPNIKHLPQTWFNYGKTLFALGKLDVALEAFDVSIEGSNEMEVERHAELFMHRGIARKAAGNADYILDLKKAAELGLESASQLLAQ